MRRTLTHQIREIIHVVLAQFVVGDRLLLCWVILCADDIVHPPFVAGSSAEHTAHKMIISVGMGKGVKGVEFIHTELLAGNKDSSRGSERNVTSAVAYSSRSDSSSGIVSGAGSDLACCGKSQFSGSSFCESTCDLIALEKFRKLFFIYGADLHHFL